MPQRLPIPGQDDNAWGQILNDFLLVEHHDDGTLRRGPEIANAVPKDALTVNVLDHGADRTGAADTAAAIQDCIGLVASRGGGTVFLPPGTYLLGASLVLGDRVALVGAGMEVTRLRLAPNVNASAVKNFVSPNGVVANAMFCAVASLSIDGNKSAQTGTSHGIEFTTYPLYASATNDRNFDSHQLIHDVAVFDAKSNGVWANGRGEMRMRNVFTWKCDGNGIKPSFDAFVEGCTAAFSGANGFDIQESSIRLTNCKAFYSGQVNTGSESRVGFYIRNDLGGISLSSCEAQDNRSAGFLITSSSRVTLAACVSDSNSRGGIGVYPGLDIWDSHHCIVDVVCFERRFNGVDSFQLHSLRIRQNAKFNDLRITHSAATGASVGSAIDQASNALVGNRIAVNGSELGDSLAASRVLDAQENLPRALATDSQQFQSDTAYFFPFTATNSLTVRALTAVTFAGTATTPTLVKYGLYRVLDNNSLERYGQTANSPAALTGAYSAYGLNLDPAGGHDGEVTLIPGQRYAYALLVVGSSTPYTTYGIGFGALAAVGSPVAWQQPASTDLPATVAATDLTPVGEASWILGTS